MERCGVNNMEKVKSFYKKFFDLKNGKKAAITVAALGILGIILIIFSDAIPKNKAEKESSEDETYSAYENVEELENKLSGIISKMEGAGRTYVMITLDTSKEYIFAKSSENEASQNDSDRKNSEKTDIAVIDSESGEKALVTRVDEAKIRGVFIVCEGGNNVILKEKIIEAVCALLSVPANKVSIAGAI